MDERQTIQKQLSDIDRQLDELKHQQKMFTQHKRTYNPDELVNKAIPLFLSDMSLMNSMTNKGQ